MSYKRDWGRENPVALAVVDVYRFLDELAGKSPKDRPWGFLRADQGDLDRLTAHLSGKLKSVDVTSYSLELQIWWRDNQKADRDREENRVLELRNAALAKLTDEECRLLGVWRR